MSTQLQTQSKASSKSSDAATANNAVKRHFSSQRGFSTDTQHYPIQAKLKIGQPGDKYEQEADRVANQVMRMPEPQCPECEEDVSRKPLSIQRLAQSTGHNIQRQCTECEEEIQRQPIEEEEEEEELLQAKESIGYTPTVTPKIHGQINSLRGGGQPLSESDRSFFEPRFGHSFSGVQVHTGTPAAEAVRAVNAKAFTVGQDIVFGAGQFAPDSQAGKQLLAHELTHVIQQTPRLSRKSLVIQRQSPSGGPSTPAKPAPCVCPRTIRKDTTLACDCTNSIRIAANNITLDCAGHTLTGSGRGNGILLSRRTGVTVKNCNITKFSNGVALRRSHKNTFTNNNSFGNTRDGFDLNDSNENNLIGNLSTKHVRSNGIELDGCNKNNLNKNVVKENQDGIDLNQSKENIMTENVASNNLRDGFRINRNSDSNILTKNTANDNKRDGFRVDGNSDSNIFTGNIANKNASDGFDLGTGRRNRCKSNTFTHPRCPP